MEACQEDLRGRFQGLSAQLDGLSSSGALSALRSDAGNNVEELCLSIRDAASSSISCEGLVHSLPLINKCCSVSTQKLSVDLSLRIEGCEALQQVRAVLAASNVPGDVQLPQHLNSVVKALRSGVFTRLIDVESLAAGADIFERFLNASCTGMSCFSDCLCTLVNQAASSISDGAEGPTSDLLGCVASWVEALVGLGSAVVTASKEAPSELRSGMVLTKVWKEIARLLQAIPADFRVALADSATAAFSSAWHELQKCIRSLVDGPQDKHALNEKLCRFWVQNCGKLINEVPACIAEMGSQVWVTAHMLYAVVSVAPTICSPSGSTMAPEQRQLLVNSLSQHLLPRIQLCAEQALSYMPEAAIQESLRELSRCSSGLKDVDGCLLYGIVPEHAWPAAVAAGGLHLLAATLAHSQQCTSLHAACTQLHGVSNLCESLRGLPSVPGISQVAPSWPAQLAPHLSACLLSSSESDRGGAISAAQQHGDSNPVVNWASFAELCACSDYLPHAVAASTVSWVCTSQRSMQPQCGAALSRMFWGAAQRCASCMLEAQSCGVFARRFMDAVAACRCALVAAITDESGGAMQHLRQQFEPQSRTTPTLLFNPVSCLAVSALLLAAATDITGDCAGSAPQGGGASLPPSPLKLLEDSTARKLTEHACSVLQWALGCVGKQDAPDTLIQGNVVALLSLVTTLTAQLCCEKQAQVPEALRATAMLLLVVVCEAGCDSEEVPLLLLRTLQHSLATTELKLFAAHTHGLHARALAALALFPCAASTKLLDRSLSPAAELTVMQCWQNIFTHVLDACDSRALAAMLPWFAEYCISCANCDYTHAVPEALLGATRTASCGVGGAGDCPDESLFLALLQRAQEVRRGHAGSCGGTSGQGQEGGWLPHDGTVHYTCLAISEALAEWTVESQDVQCTVGRALWQQVAAAVKCEVKVPDSEHSRGAQLGPQFGGGGKENWGGGAGNKAIAKDWNDAATRDAALRDAVRTLRAVQQGEQACNSSRAKGLLHVCSQLQALL